MIGDRRTRVADHDAGTVQAEVTAVAAVGEAALQRLQPNVLVSDIGMPGETATH